MVSRVIRAMNCAWGMPPREVMRKLHLRLKGGPKTLREKFETTPNAMDWTRHWSNFTRIELAARHRLEGWQPFGFEGRTFLELGCGMTAGLAPLALFLGARKAVGIEPSWMAGILNEPVVAKQYYLPMWTMFCSVYGERMGFRQFLTRLRKDLIVHPASTEHVAEIERPDLVWSLSCLEHIPKLSATIKALAGIQRAGGRQIHVVDYGNHHSKTRPFDGVYDLEPAEHHRRYGDHINLFRHPDVMRLFEANGYSVRHLVIDWRDLSDVVVSPFWANRYSPEDLSIRVAAYFVERT